MGFQLGRKMRTYKPQLNEHISRCLILSGLPNDQILDILADEGIMTNYALKYFAENIVKECCKILDDEQPLDTTASKILASHFGVPYVAT